MHQPAAVWLLLSCHDMSPYCCCTNTCMYHRCTVLCTRTAACTADVPLPYSRNPISEAVNSLLHRAGMMTSYPSTLQPGPYGELLDTAVLALPVLACYQECVLYMACSHIVCMPPRCLCILHIGPLWFDGNGSSVGDATIVVATMPTRTADSYPGVSGCSESLL
jgi:hypothetical protein